MSTVIAGIEIPDSAAAAAATRFAREHSSPLIYDHSRRVYLFGSMRAHDLGLEPDPELLYVASMMHDVGLSTPFSETEQRFELDGADQARRLLEQHGFERPEADIVWTAIALHTTPGVPVRMGAEVAATQLGVLVDAVGLGLEELDRERVAAITAAHPRGDFKNGFLEAFVDGLAHRPDTTYGTVNADVLAEFVPGFRRGSMVERIASSAWAE
jgi:HD domain-containing protein